MLLAVCAGCEDSGTFNPEEFCPTTGYAIPVQDHVIFDNLASSFELEVSSEGEWTCSSDSDWAAAEKSADGQSAIITVTENLGIDGRTAKVGFYMDGKMLKSVYVIQNGALAVPELNELSFSTYASYKTIKVSANCSWTCSSDSEWVSAVKDDNGESMTISVSPNETDAERTATVGIYIGDTLLSSVSVTQERPYAYAESDLVTLRGFEASHLFNVNYNCSWTCSVDSDWIFAENQNKGTNILIGVRENTTSASRTATVSIYTGDLKLSEITVIQKSLDVNLATINGQSANCYIVSMAGNYMFPPVKGNSTEAVGNVASVEVLWESFGTSVKPAVGDLISDAEYVYGNICFSTPSEFKEGNAVIAAKDAAGTILWSWHIWLTDQPQGQVYYNNAGTMMDRNLGATSATPGDVGALGLLYQWGRKDPFLSSSVLDDEVVAESTITWPSVVSSTSSTGTIGYVISHPTTFVYSNGSNFDWYYTGDSSSDTSRWTTSDKPKSIYDPCPAGWRVPDGGKNGVWAKAYGMSGTLPYTYDKVNSGVEFSNSLGSDQTIWYPSSGMLAHDYYSDSWVAGELINVGVSGEYWSASHDDFSYGPNTIFAAVLQVSKYGSSSVDFSECSSHAYGHSVRCIKE